MMRAEPQAAPYRPDIAIAEVADFLADRVHAAEFPSLRLRFRNRRWDRAVGLDGLSDDQWTAHFGAFKALPDNLPQPLALRYHGHQFRVYNPEIGDGRGFLAGQLRDGTGRLLDLGTKGSGTTPWSRTADGRLTLKGAVREILATEMLEALGVYTSKTFSVIETGEQLVRGDEPSPTRSAVLVRLGHAHIRIGSFQRLYALGETENLARLVDYCLRHYPGPPAPDDAVGREEPAVVLLHQAVERLADLAASYMVAGFVHGVLNSDNMAITGESFDYGPWRFLPSWDPGFTAAYFDHAGLYAFGRQPSAIRWNLGQLALALSPLAPSEALVAALDRFGPLYQAAMVRRFLWRLGVASLDAERDLALVEASELALREAGGSPELFFHRHRGGRNTTEALAEALAGYAAIDDGSDAYWQGDGVQSMLIDEVEAIWAAIADGEDWGPLERKVASLRELGAALGEPPVPQGHLPSTAPDFAPDGATAKV
jgi:uncharacterized protein YdiU (UPF0061 family)